MAHPVNSSALLIYVTMELNIGSINPLQTKGNYSATSNNISWYTGR